MKKIIFFVLLFSSSIVFSEEIKLSCDMRLSKEESGKKQEVINYKEVFSITDNGKRKDIRPSSNNVWKLSTNPVTFFNGASDYSNSSEWNIVNTFTGKELNVTTSIKINRNDGTVSYSHFWVGRGILNHIGTGNCIKLDQSTKKF